MIDLYGMGSPNVLKVILMLEETALPYRFHFVDIWRGEQFTPNFMRLNPNSKTPVIVDSDTADGANGAVFESGAILIYLAEKTGLFLPPDRAGRCAALQWMMVQMTGVGPAFGQYIHFRRFAPQPNEYGQARFKSEAMRLLGVIDTRLAENPFVGGPAYTIADIALYPWLSLLAYVGLPEAPFANVRRWLSVIAERPAAKRMHEKAIEIAPLDKAARKASTPTDADRLYGRGAHQRG